MLLGGFFDEATEILVFLQKPPPSVGYLEELLPALLKRIYETAGHQVSQIFQELFVTEVALVQYSCLTRGFSADRKDSVDNLEPSPIHENRSHTQFPTGLT